MRITLLFSLVCIFLAFLGVSLFSVAPPIQWAPGRLIETVPRGEARVRVVSFANESALEDVVVTVVPELEPYVSVEPTSFDSLAIGDTVEITVTVSAPLESPVGSFEGTIHVRDGRARGSRRTYARPLPVRVSVTEAQPFEQFGSWNLPDPGLTAFAVVPERANPGDAIELRATVTNEGTGPLSSPKVVFLSGDNEIARVPVGALGPGEARELTAPWTAPGPGRHVYLAELQLEAGDADGTATNNVRTAVAFSSGEVEPQPDLSFGEIDFGSLQLTASEPASIPLTIRNPSFATIRDVPVFYFVDGERILPQGDDVFGPNAVLELASGEEVDLSVPWDEVTPGEHIITVAMNLPDTFPDVQAQSVRSWCAVVPDKTVLYTAPATNQWRSIGPSTVTGIPNWPHTHFGKTGNVGRMDRLAFDSMNPRILYGGAPTGGLWKSTNGGGSWMPLGDKWPSMKVGSVAVDPKHPRIIYAATGSSAYRGGEGVFKSVDGGQNWHIFASKAVAEGASHMVIRYPTPNQVLIYLGSNRGLLRYVSSDPFASKSAPGDWTLLKKTDVLNDLVVSPVDDGIVYASVTESVFSPKANRDVRTFEGVFRTRNGTSAVDENDAQWTLVTTGLPSTPGSAEPLDQPASVKLDIFRSDPRTLYAGVVHPFGRDGVIGDDLPFLGIYQTDTEGDLWFLRELVFENNGFLDFFRVHPVDSQIVFYGGVHFFVKDYNAGGLPRQIEGVHDDIKSLNFDPATAASGFDHYYVLTDGGIWRCKVSDQPGCVSRNGDLRVTMFYDLDPSPTSSQQMIGGTQDMGTLLYQGSDQWKIVRGGDGNFSEIASDQIFYSQTQGFASQARCELGVNCGWLDWTAAANGLPNQGFGNAQFTAHPDPTMPLTLASQGGEVHFTINGGGKWDPRGPAGAQLEPEGAKVRGSVSRVLMSDDYLLAGTSQGQIWLTELSGAKWHLLYEHGGPARVNSLSLAPVAAGEPLVLFATLTSGAASRRAIVRLTQDAFDVLQWTPEDITADFPTSNCSPNVVSADGFTIDKAYVGTEAGVLRGEFNGSFWFWRPYNDGLPLAQVRDLVLATNKELRAATYGRGAWSVVTGPDIQ